MVAKFIFFFILANIQTIRANEKNNIESADNSFRDSNSTLMAFGSFTFSEAPGIFDLINEKWVKLKNFKCDRNEYSAVLLGNKVILIGGEKQLSRGVNTVQSYDLNTGEMENMPPMKYARKSLAAVEFKGRVYAIGGQDDFISFPYVEMWDPILEIWKTLTSMSNARSGFQAAVLDEEIIVVGGYGTGYLKDIESYNPVTDQWRKRTPMNEKREYPGVAVVNGYLYAVGGDSRKGKSLTAERYEPKTNKWTMIHPLNHTRYAMGSTDFFGKLVIVGGFLNGSSTDTMEMYDDESDIWISMPSMYEPRCHFNVVKIPCKLAETILSREASI